MTSVYPVICDGCIQRSAFHSPQSSVIQSETRLQPALLDPRRCPTRVCILPHIILTVVTADYTPHTEALRIAEP